METPLKYSCIIIDDEPIAIRVVNSYVDKIDNLKLLGSFTNALEALNVLRSQRVDLLFLDIEMPGINGLDFFSSIPHPPKVIFTTAYRNYAAQAFDVDAVDYLLKPISFERFLKAVNKFFDLTKGASIVEANCETESYIVLKSDKKNYKIKVDDILYIESMDDYVKVHTIQKVLVCYLRLSGFETMLNGGQFVRVHRAYIVNIKHIAMFTSCMVEIVGNQIPIGRNYREEVAKRLN
jgi:DNA-binding LytR/AlgR family response regulator